MPSPPPGPSTAASKRPPPHLIDRKLSASTIAVVVLASALVVTASVLVHVLFARGVSDLTVELLAAIIAVVLVVASVGVTIHFQARLETEREYKVELFRQKLGMYTQAVEWITKADDDGRVDKKEVETIRNHARLIALVAGEELVKQLAKFVEYVDENCSIANEKDDGSFRRVVQAMRDDLEVVEGGKVEKHIKMMMKWDAHSAQPDTREMRPASETVDVPK